MVPSVVGLIILVALVVLFAWLVWRAWRSKRGIVKWPGAILSAFATLLFTLLSVLAVMGMFKLYAPRGNPVVEIKVDSTPQLVARGEHLATAICSACHSLDGTLPLSGGKDFVEEIGIPLGSFTPPNLTPGGHVLSHMSDGELLRAIREGTDERGHLLALMSSNSFYELSEQDLRAIIAYLRSQPAVTNETPKESFTILGVIFAGAGLLPIKPVPPPTFAVAPPKGPTAEYGGYIVRYLDCALCHGKDLKGGKGGLVPAGPSLRIVQQWTEEQFTATLRTGVNPTGRSLDPDQMPWKFFGKMDDQELAAVYAYLKSLS